MNKGKRDRDAGKQKTKSKKPIVDFKPSICNSEMNSHPPNIPIESIWLLKGINI